MGRRRSTVEHPFGTIKAGMGATHFQMRRLRNVRTEMALHVLTSAGGDRGGRTMLLAGCR